MEFAVRNEWIKEQINKEINKDKKIFKMQRLALKLVLFQGRIVYLCRLTRYSVTKYY